jgi:hypothetical protein
MTAQEQRVYDYLEGLLEESTFNEFYEIEWNKDYVDVTLMVPEDVEELCLIIDYDEVEEPLLKIGFNEIQKFRDEEAGEENYVFYRVNTNVLLDKFKEVFKAELRKEKIALSLPKKEV